MRNLSFSINLMGLLRLGRTLNAGTDISALPAPSYEGYVFEPADATIRTSMEVGTPRQRRRTTTPPDTFTVKWQFTDLQFAQFKQWFESDTGAAFGAEWFSLLLASGATGLTMRECRFVGAYKATPTTGLNWDVAATLEARRA